MPWNSQGGGQGPWGGRPGGNNGGQGGGNGGGPGQQPPELDEIIRKGQESLKRWLPNGGSGGPGGSDEGGGVPNWRMFGLLALVAVVIWAASGIYRVNTDEQGVVLTFGEYSRTTGPGLGYHFPSPIQTVITPKVQRVNRVEIGFRSGAGATRSGSALRDVEDESLMLTGDENIVDIHFALFWQISDASEFLFNIRDVEETVKAGAESVMREIIGQTDIAVATTEGRGFIESEALRQLQDLMDEYTSGVQINQIQLQKADPPEQVIDAFRDVQRAQTDRERAQNEAQAYANDIIPRARGEAERMLQEAEAYKQEAIAKAEGDAKRFTSIYEEYVDAQDVTTRRLFLETMEEVLKDRGKVLIESGAEGGSGVVPYLPLNELGKTRNNGQGTN